MNPTFTRATIGPLAAGGIASRARIAAKDAMPALDQLDRLGLVVRSTHEDGINEAANTRWRITPAGEAAIRTR